jgi:hypothetical protein
MRGLGIYDEGLLAGVLGEDLDPKLNRGFQFRREGEGAYALDLGVEKRTAP